MKNKPDNYLHINRFKTNKYVQTKEMHSWWTC